MNKLYYILLCLVVCSCNTQHNISKNKGSNISTANSDSIITKLVEDKYGKFFNYMIQDQIINTVWAEAGGVPRLKAIVIDEKAPLKARLLACEVLLKKDFSFLHHEDVNIGRVAAIYTNSLINNVTGMANSWGLLYEYNDAGPIGIVFIILGEEAIPELVKLLNNNKKPFYHGESAATIGNAYRFRIKDFAAFYICRIKNLNCVYHKTRLARDAAIRKLKASLRKGE